MISSLLLLFSGCKSTAGNSKSDQASEISSISDAPAAADDSSVDANSNGGAIYLPEVP